MNITRILALCGALLLSSFAPRVLAQWNAYDSLMQNNSFSRGWVNPYDNTFTNAYKSYSYTPSYNTYSYFSGSRSSRASRRTACIKKMTPRQRTEMQRFAKYNGTMYTPSKTVDTPAKLAIVFARNLGGKTSDYQPVMRELLKLYQTQAKSQNAPTTDLARTMAYCISANYYYFTGGTGVPETQVAALRGKLRDALSEDAKFRALSNAQKQELNESMVILTHFAALGFEVVAPKAGDKKALVREGYKKLAGVNLRGILGVEPGRVAFDKDGLVLKAA